jgi:hypothetical protein
LNWILGQLPGRSENRGHSEPFVPGIITPITGVDPALSSLRSGQSAVVAEQPLARISSREVPLMRRKDAATVSEAVRLVAAIRITESLLRESDLALLPQLKALQADLRSIAERSSADLSALSGVSLADLVAYGKQLEAQAPPSRTASSQQELFLDARIVENDDQLLLLSGLPFRVTILFPKSQKDRMKSFAARAPAGQFEAVLADNSISAAICGRLKREVAGPRFSKEDYAFVGTERGDVKKVAAYVGNLVYCGKELRSFDSGTLLSALWYLLRSPEVFRLGLAKKGPWEMKDALVHALERFAQSLRATAVSA